MKNGEKLLAELNSGETNLAELIPASNCPRCIFRDTKCNGDITKTCSDGVRKWLKEEADE